MTPDSTPGLFPITDAAAPANGETLSGTVSRVIFENEDSGFAVLAIRRDNAPDDAVTAGPLAGIAAGERIEVSGAWEQTRRGRQFTARSFRFRLPETALGVRKYLASGVIKGVGVKTAQGLVDHFGVDTIHILDHEPHRLAEARGVTAKRAKAIADAWKTRRRYGEIVVFLQSVGLAPNIARLVIGEFGDRAAEVIRQKPYELALTVKGIGFATADRIAQALSVGRDAPERLAAGVVHTLRETIDEGHAGYPWPRLLERAARLLETPPDRVESVREMLVERGLVVIEPATGERPAFAFAPSLRDAEVDAVRGLCALESAPSRLRAFDRDRAIAWLAKQGYDLTKRQADAVVAACTQKVLVITGGPGTGKTTIVRAILDVLDVLKGEGVLAAPTGRAAKRLSETSGRPAATIHRLFQLRPGARVKAGARVDVDVLVIDEVSMLDLPMLATITASIAPHTHLVLVGDADQLASVGPGNVLADLVRCERFPVVRLTEVFRQKEQSLIIENALGILEGRMPRLVDDPNADFHFLERGSPESALATIVKVVAERLPKSFGLDPFRDILVLAPMHRGAAGVSRLNEELQRALNPVGPSIERGPYTFRVRDRVMQTANDYDREIFNGDIGQIASVDPQGESVKVDFDGRIVPVSRAQLGDLVLAYAVSVHKSQGSEYPAVVISLSMQHVIMLNRQIVYTAVTRARDRVVVVGSSRAIETALRGRRGGDRFGLFAGRMRAAGVVPLAPSP
ncbi:ATP-dependent RecD-like DNA helicase [bacterium]|nr:ATP-dependent RecD-like DNA helicase [bacterium]